MSKEFFVGIGAAKAGTTWLGRYFSNHPQVGFSPLKELHYFDAMYCRDMCASYNTHMEAKLTALLSNIKSPISSNQLETLRCLTLRLEMPANKNRYKDYFNLIAEEQHRIVGEITPSYSLLNEHGFSEIKKMYSNAKILFLMRDPVDRFWSHLRFEETCRGSERFRAEEKINDCLSDPTFILRTDYKRTLTELYKAVPVADVCVIFYEHLMNPLSHESELKKITNFLNIDYVKSNINSKVNASKSIALSPENAHAIAGKFFDVYEYANAHFSDSLPKEWKENLSKL